MKVKICVGTTCHLMGASTLIDVFEKFDGVRINCGNTWLVIIFGNVDVETSVITKYSFDDMMKEDELNEIVK